jgi:hypothetical protein
VKRILASVGLEPRIHLENLDDHDLLLLERHSRRSDAERRRVEDRHKANVAGFKNARIIEETRMGVENRLKLKTQPETHIVSSPFGLGVPE